MNLQEGRGWEIGERGEQFALSPSFLTSHLIIVTTSGDINEEGEGGGREWAGPASTLHSLFFLFLLCKRADGRREEGTGEGGADGGRGWWRRWPVEGQRAAV